jgi:hypothetical protein
LRKKRNDNSTYWLTNAGGNTHLGDVEVESRKAGGRQCAAHLVKIRSEGVRRQGAVVTAGELADVLLDRTKAAASA